MKADRAIEEFWRQYGNALNSDYVQKPISWALYQTWIKINALEMERIKGRLSDDVPHNRVKPITRKAKEV